MSILVAAFVSDVVMCISAYILKFSPDLACQYSSEVEAETEFRFACTFTFWLCQQD
jgi:hypothetical protein